MHIHVKVHVGGDVVHTGQLFFRDALHGRASTSARPYRARGAPDVRNAADSIYAAGGSRSLLSMRTAGKGYAGRSAWACGAREPRLRDQGDAAVAHT